MKFRIARHTTNLAPIIEFYTQIIGLQILGDFKDHDNYDGVFLGLKNHDWHLEFTTSNEHPDHYPDDDDLMVFYVSEQERTFIKEKCLLNDIPFLKTKNPYWNINGINITDPDGFKVVIALAN
jgi:hypothetical protein